MDDTIVEARAATSAGSVSGQSFVKRAIESSESRRGETGFRTREMGTVSKDEDAPEASVTMRSSS